MQLFLKYTPAKVGFYVPTPWHLPCTIIGIGWLFSAFTLFLYVITSCLTDLGGCRIVLRLNSVLFRLSVLQGCSTILQSTQSEKGNVKRWNNPTVPQSVKDAVKTENNPTVPPVDVQKINIKLIRNTFNVKLNRN
jgi:uncharacterized protein YceK